ncbi:MAG: ribosome small subunit-dependent GTPase A [Candidatus Cloacimonetes bacterium]|nr:ribosome small subunit-dependent GTPase A [Candidatus Cloacimonadota bacterium]
MSQLYGIVTSRHGGFYSVLVENETGALPCRTRGNLRQQDTRDLVVVGDRVLIEKIHPEEGRILEIMPRNSVLRRAKGYSEKLSGREKREGQILISNLNQVLILLPVREPDFHPLQLDRFLVMVEAMDLNAVVLIGKYDLLENHEEIEYQIQAYRNAGYQVIPLSIKTSQGIEEIRECLKDKISFLMGPSGSGKSSLMNVLLPNLDLNIGEWSSRCKTGPQTTTHTSLHLVGPNSFVADTAGFSQIFLFHIAKEELRFYYPEIFQCLKNDPCHYHNCLHREGEQGCSLPRAVDSGLVSLPRLNRYRRLLEECKL